MALDTAKVTIDAHRKSKLPALCKLSAGYSVAMSSRDSAHMLSILSTYLIRLDFLPALRTVSEGLCHR